MNIHHLSRNIHAVLHTLNIVYIIKSMNIGYQKKINSDFIQYTPNTTAFNITEYTSKYLNS